MWIVAKIKSKESSIFKNEFIKKMKSNINFYEPQILFKKRKLNIVKKILGDYIFCYSSKFKDLKNLDSIKYIKGLSYFLSDPRSCQKDIIKFIQICKNYEDKNGYLIGDYFKKIVSLQYRFLNGPLANLVFKILNESKNNFIINVSNKKIRLKKNSKIFYLPA